MAAGVHLSLVLLTADFSPSDRPSDGVNSCAVLHHCIKTFLSAQRSNIMVLKESYSSFLASANVKRLLNNQRLNSSLGEWCSNSYLEELEDALEKGEEEEEEVAKKFVDAERQEAPVTRVAAGGRKRRLPEATGWNEETEDELYSSLAKQIHLLLDSAPIKEKNYPVVDVHWLAAGTRIVSPRDVVRLYGALLRVSKCLNAQVEIVIPGGCQDMWSEALGEWQEDLGVGVVRVWSAFRWAPQSSCIWRGGVGIIEQKARQTTQSGLLFPGFSLCLSPEVSRSALIKPGVFEEVGLVPTFAPSHLQMLQAVDRLTVPLLWYSTLRCKLCLCPEQVGSVEIFKSLLLDSPSDSKNVGYLFCLCQSGTNPDPEFTAPWRRIKTTAEWMAYVESTEIGSVDETEDQLHSLSSYETGPILLVHPTAPTSYSFDDDVLSCEAWFLRGYDTISLSMLTGVERQNMEEEEEEEEVEEERELPWVRSGLEAREPKEGSVDASVCSSAPPSPATNTAHLINESCEIKALQTAEWIERKMVRQVATAELMFGQMPAPPPITARPEVVGVADMLACFSEQGEPLDTLPLSPIAVTTPSKPTRMHNAEDMTYQTLIDATPTSKKRRYHGVDYCFSSNDSSLDSKLMKIQQRYLISERASHCSTVSTPKDLRAIREARRKRKAGLRREKSEPGSSQQCTVEGVVPSTSSAPQEGAERGVAVGGAPTTTRTDPSKRTNKDAGHKKEKLAQNGRIARTKSRMNRDQKKRLPLEMASSLEVLRDEGEVAGVLRTVKEEEEEEEEREGEQDHKSNTPLGLARLSPRLQAAEAGKGRKTDRSTAASFYGGRTGKRASSTGTTSLPRLTGFGEGSSDKGKSKLKESMKDSDHSQSSSSVKGKSKLKESMEDSDHSQSSSSVKGKSKLKESMEDSDHSQSSSSGGKRKRKHLKTLLGEAVVNALKKNGMPRDHQNFRACFNRLFNLSKSFMEDFKSSATNSEALSKEMARVVKVNVVNVINFQQRLSTSTSSKR